jgi:DNA-binding NarL/FixJ family response regulator
LEQIASGYPFLKHTVKNHIRDLFAQIGLNTGTKLALYAQRIGLEEWKALAVEVQKNGRSH